MKRTITLLDRLRYAFDNTMSRGAAALIGWLFLASAGIISSIAGLVVLLNLAPGDDQGPLPFTSALWMTLMRAMDAGAVAGDSGSIQFLTVMFITTLAGIFLVSILIGLLTSGIEGRLEELRKGRSFVCEQDHALILGWNSQIFSIVGELAKARASQRHATIVILADQDKVEMEDALREKVGNTGRVRVVCRSGSPIDLTDLAIANPAAASSILLLAPEGDAPDSSIIKTLLALTHARSPEDRKLHIVAEIRDERNLEVAKMIGKDELQLIPVEKVVASIMVQTCRQSGLSVVYQELLDFDGAEIYLRTEPALYGKTFAECLFAYTDCTVLGVYTPEGGVKLNPPMTQRYEAGHKLAVVAEDDSEIQVALGGTGASSTAASVVDEGAIATTAPAAPGPERLLILGWNRKAPSILNELDQYVAPGSEVLLIADGEEVGTTLEARCQGLTHLRLEHRTGDITDRSLLESLNPTQYDHVITLSYSDRLEVQEADAQTLVTLLHLRQIASQDNTPFSVVSEMLDLRNRELAEVTQADDFIVSDRLISLLMSQISENRELGAIFEDLLNPEGAELYLKPIRDYVVPGRELNFYTVIESARRKGQIALGYRRMTDARNPAKQYGVVLNPLKSTKVKFDPEDLLVVLASE